MSRPIRPPHPDLVGHPVRYAEANQLESRGRLRGAAYRSPTRSVYLGTEPESVDPEAARPERIEGPPTGRDLRFRDHGEAIEVFRAAVGTSAVLGGRSAAWSHGVRLADPDDPVEIVLPPRHRVRPRQGLRVRGDLLLPNEATTTPFGAATNPARTAFDLARHGRPDRALAWVDAVLRETGTSPIAVHQVIAQHPGVRGIRQARTLTAIADPQAESPRESMLRWFLLDAGLPPPTSQLEVRDENGTFVARLDFGWEAFKVGVEYDGKHHRHPDQVARDLVRHNRLRSLGWVVIQVDAAQFRSPGTVVALLRPLLR